MYTYVYGKDGFTCHVYEQVVFADGRSRLDEYDQDYELDEYSKAIEVGDRYNEAHEYS